MIEPWQIPQTWAWVESHEIAEIVGGGTPRTSDSTNFDGGDVPWITPADLSGYKEKYISRGARNITRKGLDNSGARIMPKGTVLFSSRAPIGYVAVASNPVSTNQGFKSFVLRPSVKPDYAYYYLQRAKDVAVELSSGTTFREISGAKAALIPFPVAPIAEQERIVAEIEKQFTRLDAAVVALRRVQANLKRYRAAVLKAACEGRLVPTEAELALREGRSYEHASVLLERILVERHSCWETNHLAKFRSEGKHPAEDKWKSKYEAPASPDVSDEAPISDGWTWATLSQLAWNATYGTSEKCDYGWPGPPVLRIPNIVNGRIDLNDLKHAKEANTANGAGALDTGDLLIIRTNGSRDLIGRSAVIRERFETPHYYASYLIRYRLVPKLSLLSWVRATWNSPSYRNRIEALAATTAGQYNISISKLNSFIVPLPPETEMIRIADEVDRRLSILEELEVQVNEDLSRSDRLRQAILTRAFKGKLVPQDPNDEPATMLLARIATEVAPRLLTPALGPRRKGEILSMSRSNEKKQLSIVEALRDTKSGMAPEVLLSATGRNADSIDEFYAELKTQVGSGLVEEIRSGDKITVRLVQK